MNKKINWGILGCGAIAHLFAKGLEHVDAAKLFAVGSRTQEKADKFGEEFSVPHRYGNYENLIADPDVDIIHIATPHPMHKDNTTLCLKSGKPVLCEKPLTINTADTKEVISLAREKKLFLMEAMWTRFVPPIVKLRELLHDGTIGEVRMLQADFGHCLTRDPNHRLLNRDLGGGAILDLGGYVVALSFMIFGGPPSRITSMAHIGKTGVDEQTGMIFGYDQGQLSVVVAAVQTDTADEAVITGTEGRIKLHEGWWHGSPMTIWKKGGEIEIIDIPVKGNGYNYEAEAVCRYLNEGKLESDIMPLDESIQIVQMTDEVRRQIGIKYSMEL